MDGIGDIIDRIASWLSPETWIPEAHAAEATSSQQGTESADPWSIHLSAGLKAEADRMESYLAPDTTHDTRANLMRSRATLFRDIAQVLEKFNSRHFEPSSDPGE